jgi:hypothetical protein
VTEQNLNRAPWPDELADLVSTLSYRPGWQFVLTEKDRGQGSAGLTFVVLARGYDTYNPERGETYHVRHLFPVPPASYNRQSWQRWILDRLIEIENHEVCEFMVVDGERPFAPIHAPGWDPYVVREETDPDAVRTTFRGDEHDDAHQLAVKVAERLVRAGLSTEPVSREQVRAEVERALSGE